MGETKFKYKVGQTVYNAYYSGGKYQEPEIVVRDHVIWARVDRGRGPEYLFDEPISHNDYWGEKHLHPTVGEAKYLLLKDVVRSLTDRLTEAKYELEKIEKEKVK